LAQIKAEDHFRFIFISVRNKTRSARCQNNNNNNKKNSYFITTITLAGQRRQWWWWRIWWGKRQRWHLCSSSNPHPHGSSNNHLWEEASDIHKRGEWFGNQSHQWQQEQEHK